MERKRRRNSLLYLLLLLVVVTSCRTTKNINTGSIKGNITIDELVNMQAFTPVPMNLSAKLKMKAHVGGKSLSTKGTLGVEETPRVWASSNFCSKLSMVSKRVKVFRLVLLRLAFSRLLE